MREWNDVIKRQHDRAAELLCCNFDKILDFTWHRVQPSCHSERHSGQLISCKRRMVRGLWTFLFHLPQLHSAKIRFKWFIIWRGGWEDEGVEGWSRSSRRQLCTSLCGLNNTERRDSAKQKRNRKRPLESSFQQPHVSRPPPLTQVSLPCSAAKQVKSQSCQWSSQVGNILFRAPYSQLRAGGGCKVMELNCS